MCIRDSHITTEEYFFPTNTNLIKPVLFQKREKDEIITQFHKDVAASTQKIFEEILVNIANDLYEKNRNELFASVKFVLIAEKLSLIP